MTCNTTLKTLEPPMT